MARTGAKKIRFIKNMEVNNMEKVHYLSVEIRSNGENEIYTWDYELMLKTDNYLCIKRDEDLRLLLRKKGKSDFESCIEDISVWFQDWTFVDYKAVHCSLYTTEDPIIALGKMKKKIARFVKKEYAWLFEGDLEKRLESIRIDKE